ncbi:DUF2062 domain-containing protein [Magnetofaba australis]|uniref:DUF2062 domain-containing protein n=1 Tax=Magnetofaba australis IT-1 TaxID=1434232 RepID=A0A1Y2JZF3_9PROT|nr:DUF2062 domain-containing protein [Magnetofaba australis]OSM00277.1 hypothetical protein MAIT1_00759 [Magnetofaba australis IT-1]
MAADDDNKKRNWKHYLRYQFIRLLRLAEHPHQIALGVAWGVFISFTPYIGFHLIGAALLCVFFGGSKIAAWIGTLVGNPATFPFFFWADFKLGVIMLGRGSEHVSGLEAITEFVNTLIDLAGKLMSWDGMVAVWHGDWAFILPLTGRDVLLDTVLTITAGGMVFGPLSGALFYWLTYRSITLTRHQRTQRMEKARARHRSWKLERQEG